MRRRMFPWRWDNGHRREIFEIVVLFDFVLNCRGTGYHASSQVESLARLARRLLSGNVLIIVDHRARYWSRN